MSNASECVRKLREFLAEAPDGELHDAAEALHLLEAAWRDLVFQGSSEEKMSAWKLHRAESLTWRRPCLSFRIERHGGTVLGSTRAELHEWTIDVDAGTRTCSTRAGRRQLRPMQSRLKVEPIAVEIAALIASGAQDPRLQWSNEGRRVKVLIGDVIPGVGPKMTTAGRRKRFRAALHSRLAATEFKQAGVNAYIFERVEPPVP